RGGARWPDRRREHAWTTSWGRSPPRERARRAGDPARHEQHASDEKSAEDQRPVVLEGGQAVVEHGHDGGPDDRAGYRAEPADDDHDDEVHRQEDVEGVG